MKLTSAGDIRKALLKPKLKTEPVTLPTLGITLSIMEMNGDRLEQYESLIYQVGDDGKVSGQPEHMSAKIAVMSVVDDAGELVFTPEDVETLSASYGKHLKRIAEVGARLSGLYSAEAIEKNSEPDRADDT